MNHGSRREVQAPRPTAEEIVPRLLDAVETLCAERSPGAVGIRDVARTAGLSTGVAYRYFSSKDALLGATMDRIGERLAAAATSDVDPGTAFASLMAAFDENPAFVRIGTWALLEGKDVSEMMSKHPAARDLMAVAVARGHDDPPTFAGAILALGLGHAFFGRAVNRALARPPDDGRVREVAAEMVAVWAPH